MLFHSVLLLLPILKRSRPFSGLLIFLGAGGTRPGTRTYVRTTRVRILETGGRVSKAAREWLDTLTAPGPGEKVPSQDNHDPRNPFREAMKALGRVQAHMLARIVVEIRSTEEPYADKARCPRGTVQAVLASYADNAHVFSRCT